MATSSRYQREAIDQFLATLPAHAPLRPIVLGPDVQAKLAAFEAADARAIAEQSRYRAWGLCGIGATTFGILVGALLLFPIDAWVAGTPRTLIGALQTLALVITFGATLFITWLKPLDEWMTHRAEAEHLRGQIFAAVMSAQTPADGEAKGLPTQKLGLLMAAHINDQLGFFAKRIRQHGKKASKFSPLRLFGYAMIVCAGALGLAALTSALGVTLPHALKRLVDWLVLPDANRWQLGIATIASGVLAHATARSFMDQDERNAALYTVTAGNLHKLIDRDLARVETAAKAGDESAVQAFFADARRILEQEHAVWSFLR